MTRPDDLERSAQVRRNIMKRATMYTYGFLTAALVIALGGSALIAWMLTRTGLPFLRTWIIILIIVLLPSLVTIVWRAVRDRK